MNTRQRGGTWRACAYACWFFLPLFGLIGGWLLGAVIGVAISPRESVAPAFYGFIIGGPIFLACTGLGVWLGISCWRRNTESQTHDS